MKLAIIGGDSAGKTLAQTLAIAALCGIGGVLAGELPEKAIEVLPPDRKLEISPLFRKQKPRFKSPEQKKHRRKK